MNRRALFIALVVGILGVFLLLLYQRRFEAEASGGEKVKLLIALKQIDRGKPITEDAIATREVPQAYVEERAIKEIDKAKVLNLKVGNLVRAQQTLMWTDLVTATEEQRDLASMVQPGYRAVSIRTAREESSTQLIRPGDYVDVIGVFGGGFNSPGDDKEAAVVLLQRVLVVASGASTQSEGPKDQNAYAGDPLLTLSLTLPEAQILALAADRGRIAVALRNPDDQRTAERLPDINMASIVDSKQRTAIQGVRSNVPQRIGGNNP
jgi:pilus assembly protein CpaB